MPIHPNQVPSNSCNRVSARASRSAQKLLEPNDYRKGVTISNQGTGTLWIDFGNGVTLGSYLCAIGPGGYWESPFPCSEALWGISSQALGQIHVREFS